MGCRLEFVFSFCVLVFALGPRTSPLLVAGTLMGSALGCRLEFVFSLFFGFCLRPQNLSPGSSWYFDGIRFGLSFFGNALLFFPFVQLFLSNLPS